jgi:hypothetical protein
MLPWGHAAVAYLLLSGGRRYRGRPMTGLATVTVLVASQLPDLIDKPLSWHLAVLPNGRTLAHSLLTGSLVLAVLVAILLALGVTRRRITPLVVGFLSHPLADAVGSIVSLEPALLASLAWPILPAIEYEGPESVIGILAAHDPLAPMFLFQLGLVALATAAWWGDGRPGLRQTREWVSRRLGRAGETG